MVAHKAVNDKLSGLQKSAPYFNAITNTKKMFILVQIIDYRAANELSRRVSTLLKGLIRRKKKLCKSSRNQVSTAMERFYKRISNCIKTSSITTPSTGKFARVNGWAKKHRCSIECDHTTVRFIKIRPNKISWKLAKFSKV